MGKIAFVFSGQGAQYGGMGEELSGCSPAAKKVFDMADGIRAGTSRQCFTADKEELAITANTQPCVFCVDLAAAESLKEAGVMPDAAAGFSLGEIAALTFAGVFAPPDAFAFVCKRAGFMQKAAEKTNGAMAAVLRLSNEKVEELCSAYEKVFPVNYNCPGQLVVAGEKSALDSFCGGVKTAGGKAVLLPVGGGFHSPFMDDASDELYNELGDYALHPPVIPVYANRTAQPYGHDVKGLIAMQVKSPVLWQKTIENMVQDGIDTFIEVGPGKTLCGFVKKIAPHVHTYNVENKETLDSTLRALDKGE
ncbi:MAG: ACP S-malonyltransferase [Bacillota bacterium]